MVPTGGDWWDCFSLKPRVSQFAASQLLMAGSGPDHCDCFWPASDYFQTHFAYWHRCAGKNKESQFWSMHWNGLEGSPTASNMINVRSHNPPLRRYLISLAAMSVAGFVCAWAPELIQRLSQVQSEVQYIEVVKSVVLNSQKTGANQL